MIKLTKERVESLFNFDPKAGLFIRRVSKGSRAPVGAVAGRLDSYGYRQINIDGRLYLAHRLAWFLVHGAWPERQIDHCNGIRDDNRIENLREATEGQNQQNVSKRSGATSRFIGVTWHKHARKWQAKIQYRGVKHHIGYFATEELAHDAYVTAKAKLHAFNPTLREGAACNGSPA